MFSLCFIELQQMSNKLEKLDLFKLPSILCVQRTERWVSFPNPAHQRNAPDGSCTRLPTHPRSPSSSSSHVHGQTLPHKSKLVFGKKCTREPRIDLKIQWQGLMRNLCCALQHLKLEGRLLVMVSIIVPAEETQVRLMKHLHFLAPTPLGVVLHV